MSLEKKNGILLETGTNELELMEYRVADMYHGVNVLKIKRIIIFEPERMTLMHEGHEAFWGLQKIEGEVIPIVDMRTFFKLPKAGEGEGRFVIITEFNEKRIGFIVDKILAIRRISWTQLQSMEGMGISSHVTAIAPLHDRELPITDLESIVQEIFPDDIEVKANLAGPKERRGKIKIACADDSITIQRLLSKLLTDSGYNNVDIFNNGQDLYDQVLKSNHSDDKTEHFDIVLTDIEMPKMDGLTLCKKLKEEFPELTVVVVSSMISEQILRKCETVKADSALSKNNLDHVIHEIDKLKLK